MPAKHALLALAAVLGLAASAGEPTPPGGVVLDGDEQQLAFGRAVPGFGGIFAGADGGLHVYLLDPGAAAGAAEKALGLPARLHRADFTFERLVTWKRALGPTLALPGVTSLDADEARNRVVVGVARDLAPADRTRLKATLAGSGVPAGAVILREGAPFAPILAALAAAPANSGANQSGANQSSTSLQDTVRPIPGGVQVSWFCDTGGPCRPCTDGFTAFRGRTFGFVTCSHCSHQRSVVTGTRYFQSTDGAGGAVGTEMVDPPFVSCNGGRRCRGSDVVFARFDKKNLGSLGRIARPSSRDPVLGSLIVTPANSRFNVKGAGPLPLPGDTLHKVGRTTGWTYGPVVATCIDVNLDDTDITMTCQTEVAAGVGVGDSGSPVFTRSGSNGALLQGIVWGAGEIDGQATFLFSPLAAIERELGPLRLR